jgi:ferric-dicitrate binding protein FerR (iron transport regulator)
VIFRIFLRRVVVSTADCRREMELSIARSGVAMKARALSLLALLAATGVVCLAQFPGATSDAAQVLNMQGRVDVLQDGTPWALNTGDKVPAGRVIVTGPDGWAQFRVSDGSTFEIYPNTRVTFRANGGNWRDLLDVWLGRIRVHIQRPNGQPNPNRVHTPTAVISVRGTTFDVSVNDDDESTFVAVEEGAVAVEHRLMPRDGDPKVVKGGESVVVYRNLPLSAARRIDKGRVAQILADALWQVLMRTPRLPGGTGGAGGPVPTGGGPLPGDTGATPPPPPPPAPPPPPL